MSKEKNEVDLHGKTTLKRQNTDEDEDFDPQSPKKQKISSSQDEENRLDWIQQQLTALQERAQEA